MSKLIIDGVTRTFPPVRGGSGSTRALEPISLSVADNDFIAILGPSGCGKSTLLRIVAGLDRASDGRVLLDGADLTELPMYLRARTGISYLPQEPSIFRKLTVEENIMAVLETLPFTAHQRRERLEELLEELGLQQIRRSYGYLLSGGERRRVEIARSLVISPSFVLLDEPFSGIDPLTVIDIQNIILDLKQSGIGVLLTDHNVRETLQVTDRAYIISGGRIFRAGTPQMLGNDTEVKRIYLGDNFRLAI